MKELIIHPRLQKEGYKGTPHLEAFAEAVEALQCPLCYNGDITSPESLTQILTKLPRIDTVMIGRGILQNPGLLQELKAASTESVALPSCEERLAVLKEFHTSLLTGYQEIMSGDTNTLYKMKDLWTFLSHSFESPDKYVKRSAKPRMSVTINWQSMHCLGSALSNHPKIIFLRLLKKFISYATFLKTVQSNHQRPVKMVLLRKEFYYEKQIYLCTFNYCDGIIFCCLRQSGKRSCCLY